jgi:hypothetical protein
VKRNPTGKRLRFLILERDGFRCRYCGRSPNLDPNVVLHVDHVVAVAQGGKTCEENLVTACWDCNIGKTDKILEQGDSWKLSSKSKSIFGSPFLTWLIHQVGREDAVGDLARDVSHERLVADYGRSYRQFALFLRRKTHHSIIHGAGWHAWREWSRGKPTLRTAITIADNKRIAKEDREPDNTRTHTLLSTNTEMVLKYIAVRWQGELDLGPSRNKKYALLRAIRSVSTALSCGDLVVAADNAPEYPKFCRVWLRQLSHAERDGLNVNIFRHHDDGTITIGIEELKSMENTYVENHD